MEYSCTHLLIYCRKINCLLVKGLWRYGSTILVSGDWELMLSSREKLLCLNVFPAFDGSRQLLYLSLSMRYLNTVKHHLYWSICGSLTFPLTMHDSLSWTICLAFIISIWYLFGYILIFGMSIILVPSKSIFLDNFEYATKYTFSTVFFLTFQFLNQEIGYPNLKINK